MIDRKKANELADRYQGWAPQSLIDELRILASDDAQDAAPASSGYALAMTRPAPSNTTSNRTAWLDKNVSVKDVQVYNRALSDAEIAEKMSNTTSASAATEPVAIVRGWGRPSEGPMTPSTRAIIECDPVPAADGSVTYPLPGTELYSHPSSTTDEP